VPAGLDRYLVIALLCVALASSAAADDAVRRNWFETPFDQALDGAQSCPPAEGPLITEDEMRRQAHGRIERGTSCWLAGQCEDSNVYRRDPQIQQRVLLAVRADPRLARSSIWITTERRWVTLAGCADSDATRSRLLGIVRRVEGVERVFDRTIVGTRAAPRWAVGPQWLAGKKKPTR
jgi:hypothetical protein